MDKKVATLINDQINKEFYSAYLYLEMSAFFAEKSLDGLAGWFRKQAAEEQEHAMKFYDYLHDNGEKVTLKAIAAPAKKYKSVAEPIKEALKHEKFVTDSIHKIYSAARKAEDFRSEQFLDWFVAEQAEEEKNAQELVDKITLYGDAGKGLYMLDKDLGARE